MLMPAGVTTALLPHAGRSSLGTHVGCCTGLPLTSTLMFVQATRPPGGSSAHLRAR